MIIYFSHVAANFDTAKQCRIVSARQIAAATT
jgi:hypothetical protein